MIEIIAAVITSLVVIALTSLLSKHVTAKLMAATNLCSIAFIYVGFALIENVIPNIILEVSVAAVFYFIAIYGYSKNSLFIAYGIILHGLWDFFHHQLLQSATTVPEYWPSYCSIVDIILGLYFLLYFKMKAVPIKSGRKNYFI